MLEDSDRLLHTIEQVLRAGSARLALPARARTPRRSRRDRAASASSSRGRAFTSTADALDLRATAQPATRIVLGDADELKAAVWNLHRQRGQVLARPTSRIRVELEEVERRSRSRCA